MTKNKKNQKNNSNKLVFSSEQEKEIIEKTNKLIADLEQEKKSIFKSSKNKNLIDRQIMDLKKYLEQDQFHILNEKLIALEKMNIADNQIKEDIKRKSFSEKIEDYKTNIKNFDRWPLYSRIKKINNEYEGNERNLKIFLVCLLWFVLFFISLIGVLLIVNTIPYNIAQDSTRIGPWIIFSLPFAILFFV